MLAMAIANSGYSEAEAPQIMIEGGDADKSDEWIQNLRDAGLVFAGEDAAFLTESHPQRRTSGLPGHLSNENNVPLVKNSRKPCKQ